VSPFGRSLTSTPCSLVVADYIAMLADDSAGRPYGRILVERIEELIPTRRWKAAYREITEFDHTARFAF